MKRYESDGTLLTRSTYNSLQYFASRDPLAGTYYTIRSANGTDITANANVIIRSTVRDQFESIAVRGKNVHTSARNYLLAVSVYLYTL